MGDTPADERQRAQRLAKARQEGREAGRGWVTWLRAMHGKLYAEHQDDLARRAEITAWYHQREAAKATAEAGALRAAVPEGSTAELHTTEDDHQGA